MVECQVDFPVTVPLVRLIIIIPRKMAGCGFKGVFWRLLLLVWLAGQLIIKLLQLLPMQDLLMLGQSEVEREATNMDVTHRVKVVVLGAAGMDQLSRPR